MNLSRGNPVGETAMSGRTREAPALDPAEVMYRWFVATHDWIDEDTPRCVVLEAMATGLWSSDELHPEAAA